MDVKIKEFAALQGVSESIVYRHIRQHREELGENIIKKAKATWITDAGQAFLRTLMLEAPMAISESADRMEIARLQREVNELKDKLIAKHEEKDVLQAQLWALSEAKRQLESHSAEQGDALQTAKNEAGEALSRLAEVEEKLARAEKERDDAMAQAEAMNQRAEALNQLDFFSKIAWIFRKGE